MSPKSSGDIFKIMQEVVKDKKEGMSNPGLDLDQAFTLSIQLNDEI